MAFFIFLKADIALSALDSSELSENEAFFSPIVRDQNDFASRTFVIFIQGDGDHYNKWSSTARELRGNRMLDVYAGEAREAESSALLATEANVVLLYLKRTPINWSFEKGASLKIYSRGKLLDRRDSDRINASDPETLSALLSLAKNIFPQTKINLIMRSHSFLIPYQPQKMNAESQEMESSSRTLTTDVPFSYGFPESPYGPDQFEESLRGAQLTEPLESLSLASCWMADFHFLTRLQPYAKTLIASEVEMQETGVTGMSYFFLIPSPFVKNNEEQIRRVAQSFSIKSDLNFSNSQTADDSMMEYPVSVISLVETGQWTNDFKSFQNLLKGELNPERSRVYKKYIERHRLYRGLSHGYKMSLVNKGLSPQQIELQVQLLRLKSGSHPSIDLGIYLDGFVNDEMWSQELRDSARSLKQELKNSIQVMNPSITSDKLGVSVLIENLTPPL